MIAWLLEHRYTRVTIAVFLLCTCVVEITWELGWHDIGWLGVHHGLLLFSLGTSISAIEDMRGSATTLHKDLTG